MRGRSELQRVVVLTKNHIGCPTFTDNLLFAVGRFATSPNPHVFLTLIRALRHRQPSEIFLNLPRDIEGVVSVRPKCLFFDNLCC